MAISVGMEETFRLGEVFSKSFNAFGRHVVAFLMLSAIAHIPSLSLSLWEFTWVRDGRVMLRWMVLVDQLTFVVGFACVISLLEFAGPGWIFWQIPIGGFRRIASHDSLCS